MYTDPILLMSAEKVLKGTEKLNGTEIAAMTVTGLVVVFAGLLILIAFLYITGGIFDKTFGKKKKTAEPPVKKVTAKPVKRAPLPQAAPPPAPVEEDDSEVIAVIMAAVAAMGEAEGKQYRLRSVRQAPRNGCAVWSQAGISEATRPF